jgi:hypothetical protein
LAAVAALETAVAGGRREAPEAERVELEIEIAPPEEDEERVPAEEPVAAEAAEAAEATEAPEEPPRTLAGEGPAADALAAEPPLAEADEPLAETDGEAPKGTRT